MGSQRSDFEYDEDFVEGMPPPRGRNSRCPRCGYQFRSLRRWNMACPACGHTWLEESRRGLRDKFYDSGDTLAFGVLLFFGLCFFGVFLFIIAEMMLELALHGAVVMVLLFLLLVAVLALIARIRPRTPGEDALRDLERREGPSRRGRDH